MSYYHICTDALSRDILFHDEEDYIVGFNYLAICTLTHNVHLLAFCFMSNHVHIVLEHENVEDIRIFISSFKRRYSMWLNRKYSEHKFLKKVPALIKPIDNTEALKRVIAYVLRNPIAAGLNINHFQYQWSSAKCLFSGETNKYTSKTLSRRRLRSVTKSRSYIHKGVTSRNNTTIDLEVFVDKGFVESLFRTMKAYAYFMSKCNDLEMELKMGLNKKIVFSDNTILMAIKEMCNETFSVPDVYALSLDERCSLIPIIKRNFNASPKQIARLLNIDPDVVLQLY